MGYASYRVRLHGFYWKAAYMEDKRNKARHAGQHGLSAWFMAGWLTVVLMVAVGSMVWYVWSMPSAVPADGVSMLMG